MVKDIIENEKYKKIITKQIIEIVTFLIENNKEFSVTANIKKTVFNPKLPEVIADQLEQYSLFVFSNYTFSTLKVDENFIYFEAGFGSENFGSNVKIPLYSILQIIIDESILYLNPLATVEKFHKKDSRNSFSVFKNNPKNKKFKS